MKILVLSDDFPPHVAGGAGIMAFRLTKEFVAQGHDVLVVSTTSDKAKVGSTFFEGVSVFYLYSNYHERWRSYVSLWNPWILKDFKKILKEFRPDIVHAHNVHRNLSYASLLLAKKCALKVFMTAHDIMSFYPGTFTEFIDPKNLSCPNMFDYRVGATTVFKKLRLRYNPFRNFIVKKILGKIDGVITVSRALEDALTQNGIRVFAVIHNGINVDDWRDSEEKVLDFKKKLGLVGKDVIFFGGRLSGAKGGELVLNMMKRVIVGVPNSVLLVVGRRGAYTKRMESIAKNFGISDHIVFTDWLDEANSRAAYYASSVVIVPSVCFDSFPNNNLEAFAAGRPVVATCFGGSKEIVRDDQNGFIVNPFDVDLMASKATSLLKDKELAKTFGNTGHQLVKEHFLIKDVASNYLSFFYGNKN